MSTDTHAGTPTEPISLTSHDELDSLISTHSVVLVDFYADWCGPCRMMESTIDAVAAETDAAVVKVNVDRLQPLAAEFGVQAVPTLIVFSNGEMTERLTGMQSQDALERVISTQ